MYIGEWVNDRKEGRGVAHESGDWITAIWKANKLDKNIKTDLFPVKHKLLCLLQKPRKKGHSENSFKDVLVITQA